MEKLGEHVHPLPWFRKLARLSFRPNPALLLGSLASNVADQTGQLIGDLGQVLLGSVLKLAQIADMFALLLFDVSHHHHGILQIFDRRLHLLVVQKINHILAEAA